MSKLLTLDPVTDAVDDSIASFAHFIMRNRQPDRQFKPLYDKIVRPSNIAGLAEIKLNSVMRGIVKQDGQKLDGRMKYVQNCVQKGAVKIVSVMDSILKNISLMPKEVQARELMGELTAAIRFLGTANYKLVQHRRHALLQREASHRGGLRDTTRTDPRGEEELIIRHNLNHHLSKRQCLPTTMIRGFSSKIKNSNTRSPKENSNSA